MIRREDLEALMERLTGRIVSQLQAKGCRTWPEIEARFRETWPEMGLPEAGIALMLPYLRRHFDAGWRQSPEEVSFVAVEQWGERLYQTLLQEGATEAEATHWAHAFGQRVAGADQAGQSVDPKALAERSLARFRAGETEPPKEVLAQQLFLEALRSLTKER